MNGRENMVCKALSHPLRRQLLAGLVDGECDVSVMQKQCGADQPTVSKHLAVLREAGLVTVRTSGRRRCYTLTSPELVRELLQALSKLSLFPRPEGCPQSPDRDAAANESPLSLPVG